MSRGAKIGCAVVALLFVLAGVVCAGGAYFARGWFRDLGTEYDALRPQLEADARAVAAGGADACVRDGLGRAAGCSQFAIKCRVNANLRTKMCLEAATESPEFCAGVPGPTDIIDVSLWGIA